MKSGCPCAKYAVAVQVGQLIAHLFVASSFVPVNAKSQIELPPTAKSSSGTHGSVPFVLPAVIHSCGAIGTDGPVFSGSLMFVVQEGGTVWVSADGRPLMGGTDALLSSRGFDTFLNFLRNPGDNQAGIDFVVGHGDWGQSALRSVKVTKGPQVVEFVFSSQLSEGSVEVMRGTVQMDPICLANQIAHAVQLDSLLDLAPLENRVMVTQLDSKLEYCNCYMGQSSVSGSVDMTAALGWIRIGSPWFSMLGAGWSCCFGGWMRVGESERLLAEIDGWSTDGTGLSGRHSVRLLAYESWGGNRREIEQPDNEVTLFSAGGQIGFICDEPSFGKMTATFNCSPTEFRAKWAALIAIAKGERPDL